MPTQDGLDSDHPLPAFLAADETDEQDIGMVLQSGVMSSRSLKVSIFAATAAAIGIASLWVGNPVTLLPNVMASLPDISALQRATSQSAPTVQATADTQALQSTPDVEVPAPAAASAPARDEVSAASESAAQTEAQNSETSSDALFTQFQAWAAKQDPKQDPRTQVESVQPEQDDPAPVAEKVPAPAQPMQKHRRARSAQNARAEIRHVQKSQARLQREQNARADIRPVQDARAQEQAMQNAQPPSLLQSLGLHQ